jgi:carboxymethylenebutenolidase
VTDISFQAAGGTVPGYLAVPAAADQAAPADHAAPGEQAAQQAWPGVVVIHEAFGLTDDIRRKADDMAAHGYLALAPDLYRGESWTRCVRGAFAQLRAGSGAAFEALDAARSALAARPDCTGKVGVIGFCLGGGFALMCAPRDGFGAAAVNYGDVPEQAQDVLAGACPVVGSFGRRDPMGVKKPQRLERVLTDLGVPNDIKIYPDSGHRFMTQPSGIGVVLAKVTRMSYSAANAADAWQRIYGFFGEHLR